ncbi:MAG: N-6 DNA methylase [Anaerolineales bacterium]|nr:N-6 DNA methylase [Anaerolineales bacterium]
MVELTAPAPKDVICDPASGTCGFLVAAGEYLREKHPALFNDAPAREHFHHGMFHGYDFDNTMLRIGSMNMALHGVDNPDIRYKDSLAQDHAGDEEKYSLILANPPFNVDDVNLKKVENDPRFKTYGIPRNKSGDKKNEKGNETVPNANYLWINLFATALKERGRAALVMANSASDARHSEADIRKTLIENNLIYGMLTLPSNMFYTVTLPATLWFFDKAKPDERILFIDARNIFTQIDRAHREFSDAQIQNIALISRLHKGNRAAMIRLVDGYFAQGMQKLAENAPQVTAISAQLLAVLDDAEGREAVQALEGQWQGWHTLEAAYARYQALPADRPTIETQNQAQRDLQARIDPFFAELHEALKALDRLVRQYEKTAREANGTRGIGKNLKTLKDALETLRAEVRDAESYFGHIHWLQERFPSAQYEDVTGLCKLATLDEVREQEYSLNPGRYVGVVIEEDGKTEEEFMEEMENLQDFLSKLNDQAKELEDVISQNLKQLVGEHE